MTGADDLEFVNRRAEDEIRGEMDREAQIIKARTKTLPHEKWTVGREFNRRMKRMFDERNIEIPFPHQTLYFGEDKSGQAPSANVRLLSESVTNRSSANEDGGADVRQEDKD